LDASLTLDFVQNDAGVNGQIYSHFEQPFDSFTVGPGQTGSSGKFGNVLLTQGALASLDIIPLGYLDTFTATTVRIGDGGYTVPWLKLNQERVPTEYILDLGLAEMKAKAKEILRGSASSSGKTASATETSQTESKSNENSSTEVKTATEAQSTTEAPAATEEAKPNEVRSFFFLCRRFGSHVHQPAPTAESASSS
jgi:hypothetical protein